MREQAVHIESGGGLVGITTVPTHVDRDAAQDKPVFVFLNAGLTHRVGPSRLHVRLARSLAELGFSSLRFDWSGLGDSGARTDDLSVGESIILETREAMDLMQKVLGAKTFILIGICSGATVSFLTAQKDERVVGTVLINAQSHLHGSNAELGEALRARTLTRHSWRIALRSSFRRKNWRKAFKGGIDVGHTLRLMLLAPVRAVFRPRRGEEAAPFDARAEIESLTRRGVRVFHLYSEGDEGLDYFQEVLGRHVDEATSSPESRLEILAGVNHVFTLLWSQDRLVESVCHWARTFLESPTPSSQKTAKA